MGDEGTDTEVGDRERGRGGEWGSGGNGESERKPELKCTRHKSTSIK